MKTILIPSDFSENSWNALDYALEFFKYEACFFYILHVGALAQSSIEANSFSPPKKKMEPSVRQKLKGQILRIQKLPRNNGHRFIALQEHGNLVNIVRNAVLQKKIDLIVMGTKGATGIKQAIIGSNTGDVITKVQCDVLVIPENARYTPIAEVAFATDYNTFYTNKILENLTEILRSTDALLEVLNILKSGQSLLDKQKENKDFLFNFLNEIFPDKASGHEIANGNIVKAIQNFMVQHNVGLLIMVAKNLNLLQQLLFDTTVEKLSFRAKIPLWVLHE